MIETEPTGPETFGFGTERKLFVEGKDEFAFDPHVLSELLGRYGVNVQPVGGCENVMAAVHALSWAEQAAANGAACVQCYSVIDRDYRPDDEVEATWAGGPFAANRHLIWRRHEFENYFVEPEFIRGTPHFRGNLDELVAALTAEAQRRVFYDAANLVVKELRARFRFWELPELRWTGETFSDAANAEAALLSGCDCEMMAREKDELLSADWLRDRFRTNLDALSGGGTHSALHLDKGEWLFRMAGRSLIGYVLSPRFFEVPGSDGKPVSGKPLWREVAADLMRRFDDLAYRPADLVAVRDYFRDTQPQRFPATDTAGSPPSR